MLKKLGRQAREKGKSERIKGKADQRTFVTTPKG